MKPPKHFVRAVALDTRGVLLEQQILTPAMDHDNASEYLSWLNGTVSGSKMKALVKAALTAAVDEAEEISSIEFMKFETTLY